MAKREIPEINAGSMADIAFLLLIFFLVTTTMDKDTAYVRYIPKKIELDKPPPEIMDRDICAIVANNENEILFRGERLEDPEDISEKIVEWFRKNEGLSEAEVAAGVADAGFPGYNFPFYTYTSEAQINEKIDDADAALTAYEEANNDAMIKYKSEQIKEWTNKLNALRLYGRSRLPEINAQAHIRIETLQRTTYETFALIQSEIEQALYELRDDAAKEIFGVSYGVIKSRREMDKEDKKADQPKLDLLEILYPGRIIEVKPQG